MPRTAIDDVGFELIKAHILHPETSPLNPEQAQIFERIMSVAKVLDKHPVAKHAVAIHLSKYPNIGRSRAYQDVSIARKLFNTIHSFDFDFWHTWLINDIVSNIERARLLNDPIAQRVIANEHANLIKALGNKPEEIQDPRLTEKHEFYVIIQQNNNQLKIDYNQFRNLSNSTLSEINRMLFQGNEITDVQAEEILNT